MLFYDNQFTVFSPNENDLKHAILERMKNQSGYSKLGFSLKPLIFIPYMAYVAYDNISQLTVQSTRNPYHCRWVLNSTLNSFSYTTDAIWSFQISQNVCPINAVLCNEYYVVELAWGVPLDFGVSILITKYATESASSAKGRVKALPWIGFSIWYCLEKTELVYFRCECY